MAKSDPQSWAAELYEPDPYDWRSTPNAPPDPTLEFQSARDVLESVVHIEKLLKQLAYEVSEVKLAAKNIRGEQCHHIWYSSSPEESLLSCKFCDNVQPAGRSWRNLTYNLPAGHPGRIPNQFLTEDRIKKGLHNPWDKDWRPAHYSDSD
eukprot:2225624-Rhodomonas_salina.1